MTSKYRKIMEQALVDLLFHLTKDNEAFGFITPATDDWDFPLDKKILKQESILINLSGWSLEQSYVTDGMLYVRVAFGEDENAKMFSMHEIVTVLDKNGRLLYQRVFDSTPDEKSYTLKSLVDKKESEMQGASKSRDTMRNNNPDMFRNKKE